MKKTYKIVHTETSVDWFFVEAESKEAALEEFQAQLNEGKIDFRDMETVDSSDVVEEC